MMLFTLGWLVVLATILRDHPMQWVWSTVLMFVVIHLVLNVLWIWQTDMMRAYYNLHANVLRDFARLHGRDQIGTVLRLFPFHGVLVFLEAVIVYRILARIIRR